MPTPQPWTILPLTSPPEAYSDPALVIFTNIPLGASERAQKLFSYHGPFDEIEFRRAGDGKTEEALVRYRSAEIAQGAKDLSGMLINGNVITSAPYAEYYRIHGKEHSKYAEYIASGVMTALHINDKYHLQEKATTAVTKVQSIDSAYGVSSTAQRVANYFGLWTKAEKTLNMATSAGQYALDTGMGRKVKEVLEGYVEKGVEAAKDVEAIVKEKQAAEAADHFMMETVGNGQYLDGDLIGDLG